MTGVSYGYQWIRNDGTADTDITGATDSSYTLVDADEGRIMVPCNWLQCMENSMDPVHTEWLHAYLTHYLRDRHGQDVPHASDRLYNVQRHEKIGFYSFDHGLYKRRLLSGQSDENDDWRTGHPVVFPTILQNTGGSTGGGTFQIRVPIDDTHTWHLLYRAVNAPEDAPPEA